MADVYTAGNGLRVRSFLGDVVVPALAALDADVERWANSEEGGAPFAHADAQELVRVTTQAFCLSIHSLFERQLRRWLSGCVASLGFTPERARTARERNLSRLDFLLEDVRGLSMRVFYSWPELRQLELLTNACRHGDGDSAIRLFEQHPELWPDWATAAIVLPGQTTPVLPPAPPSFDSIVIPRDWLARFVDAIAWFWDDAKYVYLNSIQPTHDAVQHTMLRLSQERNARPAR